MSSVYYRKPELVEAFTVYSAISLGKPGIEPILHQGKVSGHVLKSEEGEVIAILHNKNDYVVYGPGSMRRLISNSVFNTNFCELDSYSASWAGYGY